jgi:hypothetical protein
MSDPVVVRLRKPIEFGDRRVDQLSIRPPRAKDLRRIKDSDTQVQTALNMAGWLTGEVSQVIDELEGEDLSEVLKVVNDFFGKLLGTGG